MTPVAATGSEAFKMIGTRTPLDVIELVNQDAERLGLTQADWLRAAIHRQLTEHKMTLKQADRYRRPSTKEGQRIYNRSWGKVP